jgi:mycoredoxin
MGFGTNSGIRMYATSWCYDCRRARQFLSVRHLPFEEIDIEANPEAEEFVKRANSGNRKVPTFDVNGRIFHCSPFNAEKLALELGLSEV